MDGGDEVDGGLTTDAHYRDPAWADYVRTSSIMSNVPVTSHPTERAPLVIPDRLPVWNFAVRLLVALPAAWLVILAVLLVTGQLMWWMVFALVGLAAAASVVLARADERMLLAAGHDETASPWLALVPVVYLVRRAGLLYSANPLSYRPLWAHMCVIAGAVVLIVVGPLFATVLLKLSDAQAYFDGLVPG